MRPKTELPVGTSPDSFRTDLNRLVDQFGRNLKQYKSNVYDEASLRQEFLDPFFRALGWDVENKAGLIPQHREVEIESRTNIAGRQKRADFLFRTDRQDRFICEAKKPVETLDSRYAFQAKRYAWNKGLVLAVLTDFEEMRIYVVGSKPHPEEELIGLWKTWQFQQYPLVAQEIWDLLARSSVAEGSIAKLVEQLPRKPVAKGKARQQWLFKPDRTRTIDADFLNFLDEARRELASDLLRQNNRADLLEGTRLNEAVQRILDRLLFLRICEDRDIDTGCPLASILKFWRDNAEDAVPRRVRPSKFLVHEDGGAEDKQSDYTPRLSLWGEVVAHFRALDRRPPSSIPFFNGNLFKPHFIEELVVSDKWLAHFLDDVGDDESPYLFNYIPVEILGIIYERFLGKIVRPHGRGVIIEEKPEVRKAGGVYYTPRYIVEYIVAQTVGKLLAGRTLEEALDLRILDPACGSGSFLIHAFEVVCEHCQQWLTDHRSKRNKDWCWVEENAVHLTSKAKRRILRETLHGVDLDPQAVEVTQLSLYLKILENVNRATLSRERDLFGSDEALLPPLENNIKCGNSLIASDFSLVPDDLVQVHAFDWPVQFPAVMKAGGFDAVVGNPPYIRIQTLQETDPASVNYLNKHYAAAAKGNYDIYVCFVERGLALLNRRGTLGNILPHKFFNAHYGEGLRSLLASGRHLRQIVHFGSQQVFDGATTYTCLLFLDRSPRTEFVFTSVGSLLDWQVSKGGASRKLEAAVLHAAEWNLNAGPEAALLDKLFRMPNPLGSIAHLFVGLQTDADDVYIVEFRDKTAGDVACFSRATEQEHKFELNHLKPLLKGSVNIRRYELDAVTKRLIFPYETIGASSVLIPEKDYRKRFPKTWRYLEANRARLSKRNKGSQPDGWYGYIYKKNHTRFDSPKIVVPSLGTGSCFALDSIGEHYFVDSGAGGGGGYGIVPNEDFRADIRFLLGLLNSQLLSLLVKKTSTPFRGGYIALNRQYIERLPIVNVDLSIPADRARHDRMVGVSGSKKGTETGHDGV
jgi:hypothetical protein